MILGITVAPLATLLWLGWRLLEQDRILEAQQARQRVDRAADLVVAALQRALSSSEQRLVAGSQEWPDGAVTVTFNQDRVEAHPKGRVAYFPAVLPLRVARGATFAQGEELEFRNNDRAAAMEVFRGLAKSSDPAIRAGALLRLGRNLASTGRTEEALGTYRQLAAIDGVAIDGVPAGLIGRYARCELLERQNGLIELRGEAQRLASDLISGRWTLTAPVYWLYAGDAGRV